MKQNFSIQRRPPKLELNEVKLERVLFWVQLHGIPLNMSSENNVRHIARDIGEFLKFENPMMAHGFLRVRVVVNTLNPLVTECWVT